MQDIFNILTGEPAVIKEDAILKDAVDAIIQHSTSHKVYVVDNLEKLKGIITIETLLRQVGYIMVLERRGWCLSSNF